MGLNECVFLELSLLVYFPYPYIGCCVSKMITYIKYDKSTYTREEYRRNKERVHRINNVCYDDMYLYDVIDDNVRTGVVCYIFIYKKELIFVFRGSEEYVEGETGWQDWIDNFHMFLEQPTFQQLYALTIVQKYVGSFSFYICGHSKGGTLAQFCAITMQDTLIQQLQGIYSFNACGIQKCIYNAYQKRIANQNFLKNLHIYENAYDCVSSFFIKLCPPIVLASCIPCHTFMDYYYNHYLYSIEVIDDKLHFIEKKDIVPTVLSYILSIFIKFHQEEWFEKFVEQMDVLFHRNLPLSSLLQTIESQIQSIDPHYERLQLESIVETPVKELFTFHNIKQLWKLIS